MRTKYKQRAVDYLNEGKNILSLDDKEGILSFLDYKKTYLEIGPGKGQFILSLASRFKDGRYLVCELNKTISGIALKKIDESGLENVRLIAGDYFKLKDLINPKSFDALFLNFSDPWPKKRHEKRRLTSDDFLKSYIYILKDNGLIYFKSDNYDFYQFSKENFIKYGFDIIEENENYEVLDEFDAETEFETKFKEQGIKINRLILRKGENINYELIK